MTYPNIAISLLCVSLNFISPKLFSQDTKSTNDLSFLVGSWEVTRTYSPKEENPRVLKGTLDCSMVMDNQFIKCTYEMERPNKKRGLDEVYFNYNQIYETYESLWLSSTWPIKVLMQGTYEKSTATLKTAAEFMIQDDVMEYVQGELIVSDDAQSFKRQTLIRTSRDPENIWKYHMDEVAVKK